MLFADINKGVDRAGRTKGAVLIDVREADEYAAGHIPGAVNVPVDDLGCIEYGKETPLFLYCLSGVRSLKAALFSENSLPEPDKILLAQSDKMKYHIC